MQIEDIPQAQTLTGEIVTSLVDTLVELSIRQALPKGRYGYGARPAFDGLALEQQKLPVAALLGAGRE